MCLSESASWSGAALRLFLLDLRAVGTPIGCFFQEAKGRRTLLIINARLRIRTGCQGDSRGIWEGGR